MLLSIRIGSDKYGQLTNDAPPRFVGSAQSQCLAKRVREWAWTSPCACICLIFKRLIVRWLVSAMCNAGCHHMQQLRDVLWAAYRLQLYPAHLDMVHLRKGTIPGGSMSVSCRSRLKGATAAHEGTPTCTTTSFAYAEVQCSAYTQRPLCAWITACREQRFTHVQYC